MTDNLAKELIDDGQELRESPDALHRFIEDSHYHYHHSTPTKIIYYFDIILTAVNFLLLIAEYFYVTNTGKFYSELTLKTRLLAIEVFFFIFVVFCALFIVLLLIALTQRVRSFLYYTKHHHRARINIYGTMAIFLLVADCIMISSAILPMREYMGHNCRYNENRCPQKFCYNVLEDELSAEFAKAYNFDVTNSTQCKSACLDLVQEKCRDKTALSYSVAIISGILLILSIMLTKIVCMKDDTLVRKDSEP
ncbi:hypothetical protein TRFO_29341 [Tritrichomonas foetus]|uniref:Tetraspanin family protein n=1 Tax=Tritrichomonas foetus TaxID=1144522 RepID=A0A1J4JWC8_9EUKA|nr:hypothetical protein TRFO_29341 [Tritrichomonas foetus]|eukprot:OHT03299.1 hypothetical protein TRFO_29341 [Tritrichomonas foetus]